MNIASVRYLEAQRALLPALQTHLPQVQHELLGQKTRRLQLPPQSRRMYLVARLLQLFKSEEPRLISTPVCLCDAGSLLYASLKLLESAADQHGTHLVVIFAIMRAISPTPTNEPIYHLPLVFFFCCPPKRTLVSSLPTCHIATASGSVGDHHASLQVFLMAYTALDLYGCIDHPIAIGGRRAEAVAILVTVQQVWHTDARHLFLHCTKQHHFRRLRRGAAPRTVRLVVKDPGLGGSCIVHRSWEHLSPNPILSPANLAFLCTDCRVRGNKQTCNTCKQSVADMSAFCFIYTWT